MRLRGPGARVTPWIVALGAVFASEQRETLGGCLSGKLHVLVNNSLRGVGGNVAMVVLSDGAPVVLAVLGGRMEPGLAALVLTALRSVTAGMYMFQRGAQRFVEHAGYASDLRQLLELLAPEEPILTEVRSETPGTALKPPPSGPAHGPWLHLPLLHGCLSAPGALPCLAV